MCKTLYNGTLSKATAHKTFFAKITMLFFIIGGHIQEDTTTVTFENGTGGSTINLSQINSGNLDRT